MRKTVALLLVTSLTLAACGSIRDSRVNPFNWFGRGQSEPIEQTQPTNPLIPTSRGLFANNRAQKAIYRGRPFEEVIDLRIERVPGGAVIRATGRAARQGIYDVRLTPATEDETPVDGVLTYRLEGLRSNPRRPVIGSAPTREVTAARRVTDQQLQGVSRIRVEGLQNAQVARR